MKILIYDIETFKEMFLCTIYNPQTEEFYEFCVNKNNNELDQLVDFIYKYGDYYWVGYNVIKFDSQVIEYIIRNYEYWGEKEWWNITNDIYIKASDIIDDSNYDILPVYSEENLTVKQIDLMRIHHFDNKNRLVSLKRLMFEMDVENVEEMPFSPDRENLSNEEIESIKKYCKNDVIATYEFYKITIGETSHPLYKEKNKILDRQIIEEETGLNCLNWDDVKIGAEWNKLDYITSTGANSNKLKPDKINHFYGKRYKQFFPNTVRFITNDLKSFIHKFGNTFILNKKQEFAYKFNDSLTVNLGRGGLHSQEKPRMIVPKENEIYWQCDIGLNCGPIKIS